MDKKTLRAIRGDALNQEAFRTAIMGGKLITEEEFEKRLKTRINCCGKTSSGMSHACIYWAKIINKIVNSKVEFNKAVKKAKKRDAILWHDKGKKSGE